MMKLIPGKLYKVKQKRVFLNFAIDGVLLVHIKKDDILMFVKHVVHKSTGNKHGQFLTREGKLLQSPILSESYEGADCFLKEIEK